MKKNLFKKLSLGIAALTLICPLAMNSNNTNVNAKQRRPRTHRTYHSDYHKIDYHIKPVREPSWLRGYWIQYPGYNSQTVGIDASKPEHWKYWEVWIHGHKGPMLLSFDYPHKGHHIIKRGNHYYLKGMPYAVSGFRSLGHHRIEVRVGNVRRGYGHITVFRGKYYKVSHHHYVQTKEGLGSINNTHLNSGN